MSPCVFASVLALVVMFSGLGNAKTIKSKAESTACLVVNDTPANNVAITVDLCKDGKHTDWDLMDDGSIQMHNFCLDISGARFANGSQLELINCLGNDAPPAQPWKFDGNMISENDGKFCVDIQSSKIPGNGNAVIWGCDKDNMSQQWIVQ